MTTWAGVLIPLLAGLTLGDGGDDWEGRLREDLRSRLTGSAAVVADHPRYPWPVRVLSIGHTTASYQKYGAAPYFHHGLDIRADAGGEVRASVGGKVVNLENYGPGPAYWEVAILDDEGYLWQYHHVDRQSIPDEVVSAYKTGGRIAAGTKIGEVYYWGIVTFGERFHHVHLNVLGAGGVYLTPFAFLEPLVDNQGPGVTDVALWNDGQIVESVTAGDDYTVIAEVTDLVQHGKFTVPPHRVEYRLDGGAPVEVWDFASLPGGASNEKYVETYYVRQRTCGNYECRKHTVDLAFALPSNRRFPREKGTHHLEVTVSDYAGNMASRGYDWTVH